MTSRAPGRSAEKSCASLWSSPNALLALARSLGTLVGPSPTSPAQEPYARRGLLPLRARSSCLRMDSRTRLSGAGPASTPSAPSLMHAATLL